jgi:hypothetical protein
MNFRFAILHLGIIYPEGIASISPGLPRRLSGLPWVKALNIHLAFERSEASHRASRISGPLTLLKPFFKNVPPPLQSGWTGRGGANFANQT